MITGRRDLQRNVNNSSFTFTILHHLPFRLISRHPMIVERCIMYHSTRLDETTLMICVSFFYNHWMARYSTKRQQFGIYIYDTAPFTVSFNISPFSDRRITKHISLESPHRDESNGT